MASADSISTHGTTRFSLRSLLLFVALFAVPLALSRWNMVAGVSVAVVLAGVACIAFGIRTRSRGATIVGIVLAVGAIAFFGLSAGMVIAWVGTRTLDVHVLVVDASSLSPISGANVQALSGPDSPIEGPAPNVDKDFKIDTLAGDDAELITDKRGRTKFAYRFHAAGSDGMFKNSGYVDTKTIWLRVTAPGYATTLLPLDRQSVRPRDIDDDTPLFVTVPVGKR
jgi:hypothetical protein